MSRFLSIAVVRYTCIGLTLVVSATLLTLLFSFLGTITCSALVGLMMGSMRQWRWHVVLVSMIFPGVILAVMQIWKPDLTSQQTLLVALLCFGAFWITYLSAFALVSLENQNKRAPENRAEKQVATIGGPGQAAPTVAEDRVPAGGGAVSRGSSAGLALEDLQGRWLIELAARDGSSSKKLIEIAGDQLALSVVDSSGQVRSVVKGVVKLSKLGPFTTLDVLGPGTDSPPLSPRSPDPLWRWICRVSGRTLTVASHFEETAGEAASCETYIKMRDPTETP